MPGKILMKDRRDRKWVVLNIVVWLSVLVALGYGKHITMLD